MYEKQNFATGNAGYPATLQQAQAPTPPATLASALSSVNVLDGRLMQLSDQIEKLALQIGGPWPSPPSERSPKEEYPRPVVVELNDRIATAHDRVSVIEGAVAAMSRTLGG